MNIRQKLNRRLKGSIKQKWHGTIIDFHDNVFTFECEIIDLTNPTNPDEIITISIDKLFCKEVKTYKIGMMFYWNIFYKNLNKKRKIASKFKMIRLPKWTQKEIDAAKLYATNYSEFFIKGCPTNEN